MAAFIWTWVTTLTSYPITSMLTGSVILLTLVYYGRRPRNLPPGPWGIPFVGSPHLFGDDIHKDFVEIGKKYGEIFTLMMGSRPMIVINSHRLMKEAFVKRSEVFSNRPKMYFLDNIGLFDEIFNHHYDEEWKEHKKFQVRALRSAGFGSRLVEPIFKRNLHQLFTMLDASKERPVDPTAPIQKLLASTMATVVYGAEYDFSDSELAQLIDLSLAWMASMFPAGMSQGYWLDNVPYYSLTKWLFPSSMKPATKTTLDFQQFLIQKIHAHREELDPTNPRDVIDQYLAGRPDDPALTDMVFASTMLMLFPDGVDTTTQLIRFIVLYLAHHPDWQEQVQEEIDKVCGKEEATLDDSSSLHKVRATIAEVSRLTSPVCLSVAHSPTHDTTLDGYFIPEDSYILANIHAVHMDERDFPQGTRFVPESNLDENGHFVKNEKIIPFSLGRRMCIAEQMVKNEVLLLVSNLMSRYTVTFPEGEPQPPVTDCGGLLRAPLPFKVLFIPRRTANATEEK